ncbi:hypothetical protein RclHR1_29990001 [Rhizophagus clarus]|nr:hypothetical protein RclHR1_29990001 [Rhizophagus clarus]
MSAQTNTESKADHFKPKKTRAKISFIWQYFNEEEIEQNGKKITVIKCQVMNNDGSCGVSYQNSGNSTGNAIYHLRTLHNIDKNGKMTEHQETNTIKPIHVIKSADLKMLFKELDPGFIMPCQKSIRNIIDDAFDYTSPQLKTLMKNEATSVSLTLDLWTSKKLTLTIEYIHYPHTAEHILETLESVLEEWEIRDKVYTITTDNGSNVKKAINNMRGVKWLGCVAHTLHLVVGKGMIPAQVLIMRAKRLIDFFMRLKQSERLEIIQKKFSDIAKNSNKEITLLKSSNPPQYLNDTFSTSSR